jgi:hypothetical protein
MPAITPAASPFTGVCAHPKSAAGEHHRARRISSGRAAGFPAKQALNLQYCGGRTLPHLTFTNVYLGGKAAWSADDIQKLDWGLAAAMSDPHLNNVLAQYYPDGKPPTTAFKPSRILEGPLPHRVYRDRVEGFVAGLVGSNGLSGFDLASTVVCFMRPRGVLLSDHASAGAAEGHDDDEQPKHNPAMGEHDEFDSAHGLGGYHGSIRAKHGGKSETVYYAVGVYSEGTNGIVEFSEPWKNICAVFYHELCEARTDPDVEASNRAGDTPAGKKLLGWYSDKGGEIGDIPLDEAAKLSSVMKEVPLAHGGKRVPIQLMWSNAVGGPEGPLKTPRKPSGAP